MGKNGFHRAFGVYGICVESDQLLVIKKGLGLYANRYDLPGGQLEEDESLTDAVCREFYEETGMRGEVMGQIGTFDFMMPWEWEDVNRIHHIAVFYLVRRTEDAKEDLVFFDGQDSEGTAWLNVLKIDPGRVSPLVVKAIEWLKKEGLKLEVTHYPEWEVKESWHDEG
ncbi:NUDIX hydrolase [Alteribacter aurantiacus]|uniref:NUDIX hydrolase n=1 Tax=Alteribacter aurantiacus TaxID=254410 RepID=UPI0003FE046A|nr:NUDIX hydrolase [Alteribacter aurantiacus]